MNLAFGVEARQESYSIEAGEPASYDRGPVVGVAAGAQGFPGFQPSNELDEDRQAYSVYVDLEAQVTERFLASAAVRGEDYSDFGSAVTGKLALRYDFTDSFALRGAVSTGFRAPGLQQAFFTSTATNFIGGVPFEVGTFPATSPTADRAGRPASRRRGVDQLFAGHRAALREFRSHHRCLSHRHRRPHRALGKPQHTQVAALIAPFGASVARFFINGVDTKTEGVDLVARYLLRTDGAGRFEFVAAGNWNNTDVEGLPSLNVIDNICVGQPAPCTPPVLFGRINTLTFEKALPTARSAWVSTGPSRSATPTSACISRARSTVR